ncbi:MAG: putative toxin-antitoxin system toxin component, PIN family [Planctomycetota bacterium]|nr:putative toxin-antitoxin system toxin component, PIN family [Planctomycetota bacterium]
MRILLGTNILARAAMPNSGPARALLLKATEAPNVLLISGYILSELSRILRYERVQNLHGLDDVGIDQYLADLQATGATVEIPNEAHVSIVPHDPADDDIVATAIAGQADMLRTRDRHLHHLEVREYYKACGIRVLTDLELLEILRESDSLPDALD